MSQIRDLFAGPKLKIVSDGDTLSTKILDPETGEPHAIMPYIEAIYIQIGGKSGGRRVRVSIDLLPCDIEVVGALVTPLSIPPEWSDAEVETWKDFFTKTLRMETHETADAR